MDAAGDEHHLLGPGELEVGDGEHVDVVAAWRFGQSLPLDLGVELRIVGDVEEVPVHHGEGVRRTVGEVGDVVLPVEEVGEGQRVVGLILVEFDVVAEVGNILAAPGPAVAAALPALRYLHAVLEGGVVLEQVEDVEPHPSPRLAVVHPEEEPLRAPARIDVLLQQQQVLVRHLPPLRIC